MAVARKAPPLSTLLAVTDGLAAYGMACQGTNAKGGTEGTHLNSARELPGFAIVSSSATVNSSESAKRKSTCVRDSLIIIGTT
jgi:hypothetical protein